MLDRKERAIAAASKSKPRMSSPDVSPIKSARKQNPQNSVEDDSNSMQQDFEGGEKETSPAKPVKSPRAAKKPRRAEGTTFPDLPIEDEKEGCSNTWLKDPSDQRGASESSVKKTLDKFEQVE